MPPVSNQLAISLLALENGSTPPNAHAVVPKNAMTRKIEMIVLAPTPHFLKADAFQIKTPISAANTIAPTTQLV